MNNYDSDLLNLMLGETVYRSAEYFANALGVSTKTIYNHSKNIETFLRDNGLTLEKFPRKGFLVVGSAEKKQHILLNSGKHLSSSNDVQFTPQYRRLYLFSKLLFSERKSYRFYAETFFVSVQSIKKDFDEINGFLESNKVTLDNKNLSFSEEIKIEQSFREYLDLFLTQVALSKEQLGEVFGSTITEIATEFVDDNSQQDSHVQDEYLPVSLKESLLIFLNRVKNGLTLTPAREQVIVLDILKNTDLSKVVSGFIEICRSTAKIQISGESLRFLYLLLLGHGIRSNPNDFDSKRDFTLESKDLIRKVSDMLDVKFTTDLELLKATIYHLIPMVSRLNLGLRITDPLKGEIFSHHSLIASAVKKCSKNIEKHYHIELYDDEISLLTLHFLVAFEKHRKNNQILVVCHAGAEISQYVLLSIENNLPPHNKLTLISPSELSKTKIEKYDLIISTTNIKVQKVPTLFVSLLPREEEISPIYWRLVEIDKNKLKVDSKL